jgi:hypothetical protein
MTIGYKEYVNREIMLITKETEKRLKDPLYNIIFGDDIIYRMMVLEIIKDLKTKEFLIYFLQNQDKLVYEQEQKIKN